MDCIFFISFPSLSGTQAQNEKWIPYRCRRRVHAAVSYVTRSSSSSSSSSAHSSSPRSSEPKSSSHPVSRPPLKNSAPTDRSSGYITGEPRKGVARASTPARIVGHAQRYDDAQNSVRINKFLSSRFSRRDADALVASGRVRINGVQAVNGARVHARDLVTLDGAQFHPPPSDAHAVANASPPLPQEETANSQIDDGATYSPQSALQTASNHEYIKVNKPPNFSCVGNSQTALPSLLQSMIESGYESDRRVFPVGHLDAKSSGIVLLTSDGDLVNATALGPIRTDASICLVQVNCVLQPKQWMELQNLDLFQLVQIEGDGDFRDFSHLSSFLPGQEQLSETTLLLASLQRGRVKDIRKAVSAAVGKGVAILLHRIEYLGIGLGGIEEPGAWAPLNSKELAVLESQLLGLQ